MLVGALSPVIHSQTRQQGLHKYKLAYTVIQLSYLYKKCLQDCTDCLLYAPWAKLKRDVQRSHSSYYSDSDSDSSSSSSYYHYYYYYYHHYYNLLNAHHTLVLTAWDGLSPNNKEEDWTKYSKRGVQTVDICVECIEETGLSRPCRKRVAILVGPTDPLYPDFHGR